MQVSYSEHRRGTTRQQRIKKRTNILRDLQLEWWIHVNDMLLPHYTQAVHALSSLGNTTDPPPARTTTENSNFLAWSRGMESTALHSHLVVEWGNFRVRLDHPSRTCLCVGVCNGLLSFIVFRSVISAAFTRSLLSATRGIPFDSRGSDENSSWGFLNRSAKCSFSLHLVRSAKTDLHIRKFPLSDFPFPSSSLGCLVTGRKKWNWNLRHGEFFWPFFFAVRHEATSKD